MLSKYCDKILFSGIIFLLIFAPLAFGSVHVWAYSIVEIVVFALAGIFALGRICSAGATEFTWVKTPINRLLIALLLLIGLSLVPLPVSWLSVISPKTAELKNRAEIIIKEMDVETADMAAARGNRSDLTAPSSAVYRVSRSISHYAHATVREALKLMAYLFMFFLVLNTVDSKKRMDILVLTFVFLGLFEALYAIFQVFNLSPKVWWWKSRAGGMRYASGTFICSNHFAGYMEIALCMTWGYVLTLKKKTYRMESGLGGIRAGFQRMLGWFSPESIQLQKILFIFIGVIIGVALLLSASRGGILSISLAMLVMTVLFISRKKHMKIGLASLFFCLITFFYGLSIGIDPTLEKFERTRGLFDRIDVSKTLIPMIRDYPVTGVGWGNYPDVYPQYANPNQKLSYYNGYAHNDWLEAATEVGIPGLILMGAAFFWMFIRMAGIWRRRRNAYAVGIVAGVMAAMVSIGFHSLFDLNMHIPANPLTLGAVLGLGYVVLCQRGYGPGLTFFYRKGGISLTPVHRILLCVAVLASAAVLIRPVMNHWLAESHCPTEWNSTLNLDLNPDIKAVHAALTYNPKNAEYYYKQAMKLVADDNTTAAKSLARAVMLNPASAKYWSALGESLSRRTDDGYNFLLKWIPLADRCQDMMVACAPVDSDVLFSAAWYWVWRARLLPEKRAPSDPGDAMIRAEGVQKFQALFRQYLLQRPSQWKRCIDRVGDYFDSDAVKMGIVPDHNEVLRRQVLEYMVGKGG